MRRTPLILSVGTALAVLALLAAKPDPLPAEVASITGIVACVRQAASIDPQELASNEIAGVVAVAKCGSGQHCCIQNHCECGSWPNPVCCDATCACSCLPEGTPCCG